MEIFGLGMGELIVIAIILILLVGAKKLPELGRSIGLFGKEVKKGLGPDEAEAADKKKKTK